jgi:chromosome transmission fidelity protein 8
MIIPVTIPAKPSSRDPPAICLPPQLAKLGNDEVLLVELQGLLAVEASDIADRDGQLVGKLHFDEARRFTF